MSVLWFQSFSITLLLKLIDTAIERSNLLLLFHKFTSCLAVQMIFITFKKRSSQFWWISILKNRTLELVSRFVAPWWKHCIGFPYALDSWDELDIKFSLLEWSASVRFAIAPLFCITASGFSKLSICEKIHKSFHVHTAVKPAFFRNSPSSRSESAMLSAES